jgi:carbon-monoxide dehydrogenase large subunit
VDHFARHIVIEVRLDRCACHRIGPDRETAVETPYWETDYTETPSPHHPIGAKGVGESPNVGGVPAFSNAVNDAFAKLGGVHLQMPHTAPRVWEYAKGLGLVG